MGAPRGCDWATEEMRVGCTSHCRSWLVVMAVTVGTKEPGMSPRPLHSCGDEGDVRPWPAAPTGGLALPPATPCTRALCPQYWHARAPWH